MFLISITWYFGLPSSSSHALIGSLIGASVTYKGISSIYLEGILHKVIVPMITSPILGIILGFIVMASLMRVCNKANPEKLNKYFAKLQIISTGFMAFSHGSNDAQKTMGIITMSLLSFGYINSFEVPIWVIFICALTMGLGTIGGGWRIIKTMGSKVFKMKSIHGFAIEMTASGIILGASCLGIPISTTHVKTTAILGVGSTVRFSAVKWGLVSNIIWAWILTIPICALLSSLIFKILT